MVLAAHQVHAFGERQRLHVAPIELAVAGLVRQPFELILTRADAHGDLRRRAVHFSLDLDARWARRRVGQCDQRCDQQVAQHHARNLEGRVRAFGLHGEAAEVEVAGQQCDAFVHAVAQLDAFVLAGDQPCRDLQAVGDRVARKAIELGDARMELCRVRRAAVESGVHHFGHHRDGLQVDDHVVLEGRAQPAQHAVTRGFGACAGTFGRRGCWGIGVARLRRGGVGSDCHGLRGSCLRHRFSTVGLLPSACRTMPLRCEVCEQAQAPTLCFAP